MTTTTAAPTARHPRPRRTAVVGAAFAATLLVAAACGDDDGDAVAGGTGDGDLSVAITSPEDGAEVGTTFDLEVDAGVPLGEPGTESHHVHVFYDGNTQDGEFDMVFGTTFTIDRLEPGEHTVEAVIANADHSLTEARDQVTITVADEPAGGGTDATESDTGGYDY
jgi:hypothetical protein